MQTRDLGVAKVSISGENILVHLDESDDPITVPRNLYPHFADGDNVQVTYTGVGILKLRKV